MKILIAGIGNVLRGDDGFGPAVVNALREGSRLMPDVRVVEMGIGGFALVHELMDGYDALVVVDAIDRGGAPGSLYVLEPVVPKIDDIEHAERHAIAADMHNAVPARSLIVARAAGVLPQFVRMIGCQPESTEEFSMALSASVAAAVPNAVSAVVALIESLRGERPSRPQPSGVSPGG